MIERKFKSGDLVRHKLGGPIMEIVVYIIDRESNKDESLNREDVICHWFDKEGKIFTTLDQRLLIKFDLLNLFRSQEEKGVI